MLQAMGQARGLALPTAPALLSERVLAAALAWFAGPAAWYGRWSDGEARCELGLIHHFACKAIELGGICVTATNFSVDGHL